MTKPQKHHAIVLFVWFRLILIPLCAGLITGCGQESTPRPRPGGVLLTPPLEFPLNGLDPAVVNHSCDDVLAQQLFDGLLQYRPVTFELVPALAEKWETPDSGRTWIFHLRPNAFFNDDACFADGHGRAVTVEDVKYSLERIITWRENETTWRVFADIDGAEEFRQGRTPTLRGLRVRDNATVQIILTRASFQFLHRLASSKGYVVPHEAIEKYGERFRLHPVGTGPFRLAKLELNQQEIILVRNERYWEVDSRGVRLPYVSAIRWVPVELINDEISIPKLSGQIIACVPAWAKSWLARIEAYNRQQPAARRLHLVKTPIANTIFFAFRMDANTPYARNKWLRQAVACAFDMKSAMTDSLQVTLAQSLIPPGLFGYHSPVAGYRFNLQKAAALLQAAGFPNSQNLPALRLNTVEGTGPFYKKFRDDLASLGIPLEVEFLPKPEHFAGAAAGKWDFFRAGWICDYPDALDLFQLFYSHSPNNHSRYQNPEYDRLFEQASREMRREQRLRLFEKMEKILHEDCPAIYMLHEIHAVAIPAWVRNLEWSINPVRMRFLKYVWLDS
ncbi:MAG: ABC transporter substrate-binding protein [candidate division KSB1 bacterium]|nr:ABC transporter substrate-binding protein [candidate division KSB1 bacterium]MDZ7302919.1 ABC transporter substrate-binding protein [candidate division KSB1 bacterium]MDZ7310494.1 ABC transporter substrate-binding protein [candidate division KSB1 bacterium]